MREQQRAATPSMLQAQTQHVLNMCSLKHHALISAAVDIHPVLATTIRLLVRWLGAHLLSNHVGQEAAELLATHAFFGPSALPVPGALQCLLACLTCPFLAEEASAHVRQKGIRTD